MIGERICIGCGVVFIADRQSRKYCSKPCSGAVLAQRVHEFNRRPLRERFLAMVQVGGQDDCWPWTGCRQKRGYGQIGVDGRVGATHRVSWELFIGPIPDGLGVLHRCDNPPCCNPSHLFLGTNGDNATDKTLKGRAARKITADQARGIYLAEGGRKSIADRFGVSESLVHQIRSGGVWRHATEAL